MVGGLGADRNQVPGRAIIAAPCRCLVSVTCGIDRAVVIVLMVMLTLWGAIGSIRWAKRHSTGAQLLASAMILVLGIGVPVVSPPQQGVEEAREDKGKKGAESGTGSRC
jgi:hypothetical protein